MTGCLRQIQRGLFMESRWSAAPHSEIGAGVNQGLHNGIVTGNHRQHQRGQIVLCGVVQTGATFDE